MASSAATSHSRIAASRSPSSAVLVLRGDEWLAITAASEHSTSLPRDVGA
jgi:hypothetical protein